MHHSLGLPSVGSYHVPCPCCRLRQDSLHTHYRSMAFPLRTLTYAEQVTASSVHVQVNTEVQRGNLRGNLHFRRGRTGFGREVHTAVDIGGVQLLAGDRVTCTRELLL